MSVSEWSLPIERGGVKSTVGEYSISAIGPGPRAKRHWELARQRGLRVVAKIQANNSWELSAVPYIPALENVAQHAANLRAASVEDVMLGWTLGGYPSPNLEVVQQLLQRGSTETPAEALRVVAKRRFGAHAEAVLAAWHEFSVAFSQFPYHGGVLYSGPQQVGPANLLFEKPTGYRASMVGLPHDDLNGWRAVFPPEILAAQFEKMADGFSAGIRHLDRAASVRMSSVIARALLSERAVAAASELHFRSVANQARFILARDALSKAAGASEAKTHLMTLQRLLESGMKRVPDLNKRRTEPGPVFSEIDLARALYLWQHVDSRIGFEASNQYYYVPVDLMEKVLNCRDLLDRWLPAQRAKWKLI